MKKGKVVVVGGNAKSGKTTLSNQLASHGFYKIDVSSFRSMVEYLFGVTYSELSEDKKIQFLEFMFDYALENAKNGGSIVIDIDDFLPQDIAQLECKNQLEVYFLAYPSCTIDEIKYNIKHYTDSNDWITQIDDSYLDTCVVWFDEKNKLLVEECDSHHMKLIDVFFGEKRKTILTDLVEKIIS